MTSTHQSAARTTAALKYADPAEVREFVNRSARRLTTAEEAFATAHRSITGFCDASETPSATGLTLASALCKRVPIYDVVGTVHTGHARSETSCCRYIPS